MGKALEPGDDLWVGNWWAGFLLTAVLAIIIGSLIAGLPRGLRVRVKNQLSRRIE